MNARWGSLLIPWVGCRRDAIEIEFSEEVVILGESTVEREG